LLSFKNLHKATHTTYITCSKIQLQQNFRSEDLFKAPIYFFLKHSAKHTISCHDHNTKVVEFDIRIQTQLI
jgi:hypothetical protein